MTTTLSVFLALISSFIGSIGAIYIKKGAAKFQISLTQIIKNKNFLFGASFYFVSAIMFIFALKEGELSIIYPLASTAYIWIIIFSKLYLNEEITAQKIISITFIIIGIGLIGF